MSTGLMYMLGTGKTYVDDCVQVTVQSRIGENGYLEL